MTGVIEGTLSRKRVVLTLLAFLLTAGLSAYINIPKEAEPDVPIPIIYVSVRHEGISPEDAERLLLRPLEQELRGIEGVKEMKSTASSDYASIVLEFYVGIDIKDALINVREQVNQAKGKLPQEGDEPIVKQVTLATENPALTILLSGSAPERAMVILARTLRDNIEGFAEVLEVKIGGDREEMVEILVDPLLMASYRLNMNDIYTLVSRNNRLVAAGIMDTGKGRFPIKVPSVFSTIQDVMAMPIKVSGDRVLTFADVAQIRRTFKDPAGFVRVNGLPTISLEVVKRPGENIIATVDKVKAFIVENEVLLPNNIHISYAGDRAKDVKNMLNDLQNNVLSAVLLVVIVIVAILGVRSAALVGIAIPGSFLTGILVLWMSGITVNIVVLFALIMSVGMLVDGAIVVTEFADREMTAGTDRHNAYLNAAKRMAWPIIASTATTLAAFAPLLFWPGITGEFMKYLPLTLIATLTASLAMALIFVPVLGSVFGKPRLLSTKEKNNALLAENGNLLKLTGFTGFYVKTLHKAIKSPWIVLFLTTAVAISGVVLFAKSNLGVEFFPQVEPSGINIKVRSYGDFSIDEQDQIMSGIEQKILPLQDEIDTLYLKTGDTTGESIGSMRLNLIDWQDRRSATDIIADLLDRTKNLPGIEIEITKDQAGPPGGKALQIEIGSRYPELLQENADKIRHALQEKPYFVNIEDDGEKPGIEWQFIINRADAARYGADATLLGSGVQFLTNGLMLGSYRPDDVDDELDIRVRYPENERTLSKLSALRLQTRAGQVPVSHFVALIPSVKQSSIKKVDSRIVMTVSADMAEGYNLSLILPELEKELLGLALDPRISLKVRGENEDQQEAAAFLKNAFMVALAVMALILILQFNSFYQAFLILSAVVFSTTGVFFGLFLSQSAFGIVMSGIGVIALAGIVVNNNIVLIDTYNVLKNTGETTENTILRTGAQRIRPVLLTTVTTIFGLIPMVLKVNLDFFTRSIEFGAPSTQWWAQLATAIAGGLTFATLLTLVLTPCLLMIGVNSSAYFKRHTTKKQ
ncbi:acriflavin resistance protein [Psychromonas ingrahamii 37]|uniref:Acriflavin resistance protein n=1 Tax=Psychromonas ingrahamii (strain DSM 17664 / CCUG 51855 / 37) TaxID=357804 RepID=A1ST96_PSYIN|nr:efflux RND transporter permease subunit [Psychromonas ingrahamii]ABM02711.1 acriflavin resistance protein [Psychromonas ingrahamii 37]